MRMILSGVLAGDELAMLAARARALDFEDGARTAGWQARAVKRNLQAVPGPALRVVQRQVVAALEAHSAFAAAALPRRIAPPLISLSGPGQGYGSHVDDALMGDPPLRTDLSVTLFLSAPDACDGGALVIEDAGGEEAFRLPAGDALLYPSTSLHRVEPVTAGERLVAVTWVQSLVRGAGRRDILLDLDRAARALHGREGCAGERDLVLRARANLLREWAEP